MVFYCNNKKDYCDHHMDCDKCDVWVLGKGGKFVPTHGDRIRAMTDIELRNFLHSRMWLCETHKRCDECPIYSEETGCMSTLEWLKQPAKEEE